VEDSFNRIRPVSKERWHARIIPKAFKRVQRANKFFKGFIDGKRPILAKESGMAERPVR
jgi:hypothetical protein